MTSWDDYFTEVKPKLGARARGFEKIFAYLDETTNPTIIETGTYREENNFTGDGCSTLLFDNYVNDRGGNVISIDIDPKACALASANTSNLTEVVESDSVEFLGTLQGNVALLYLDSYNIQNWHDDWAPAAHHLKELFAAKDIIQHDTLIVIDDNIKHDGKRLGKGRLVYELMESLGIEPFLDDYQVGWVWQEL
jgi:predicted O-methyltransferase YrrM